MDPDVSEHDISYDYLEYGDFEEVKTEGYVQQEVLNIISVVIYSLAFVIGIFGNGIVIWVTAFKVKRTVNSVWLLNLAVADFVFVLFLPLSIDYVLRDFNWIFGWVMCKANSFVCTVNMYASVLSLTVLSLDRYITLVHSSWSEKHRNVPRARVVIALIWIVSCLISCPTLIFRDSVSVHGKVVCFNNFHSEDRHTAMVRHIVMITLRTTFGFLLPFLTISVTTVLLFKKIRHSETQFTSSFYKMVSAVIIAFFLCWTPFHILSLMEITLHLSSDLHYFLSVGFPLATSLAFFNSCLNPIIFGLINQKVRSIIKRSCLNLTKSSLRELSQNLSATESESVPASGSPEEATVCSSV